MRVEHLRLGGLAETTADQPALEVGRVASRCERGRVDGLAKPAEVALDAGGGHQQGAELHARAAVLAMLDVDLEAAYQKLSPGAVPRAVRGGLVLGGAGRAVLVGVVGFSGGWGCDALEPGLAHHGSRTRRGHPSL